MFFVLSCEYDKIEVSSELPENVSYSEDIIPIFNRSCNMAGCHPTSGIPPDLSPEYSYFSLFQNSLIDTVMPESSSLYLRMIDQGNPMPPGGILPENETNLVLVWIIEGAKNN